jgi:hypothetical protein
MFIIKSTDKNAEKYKIYLYTSFFYSSSFKMASPVSPNNINFHRDRRFNTISTLTTLDTGDDEKSTTNTVTPINLVKRKHKTKRTTVKTATTIIEPLLKFRVNIFDELIEIEKSYWNDKQKSTNNEITDQNRNVYTQAFFNLLSYVLKNLNMHIVFNFQ